MGSLSDLFRKYHYLIEDAFDLDTAGNLIEKDSAKVIESDDLFHEIFMDRMVGVLKELAYDREHEYERPGVRDPSALLQPSWFAPFMGGGSPTSARSSTRFIPRTAPTPQGTQTSGQGQGQGQPRISGQPQAPTAQAPIAQNDNQSVPGNRRQAPNDNQAVPQSGARPLVAMKGNTFAQKAPGIMQNLMRDFNLTDYQAAAIVGNIGHETGGFRYQQELRPTIPGSRGGLGWAQWTGPRRRDFENYSQQNGLDPKTDEANYGFLKHEIETKYPKALENLRNTPDLKSATYRWEGDYEGSGVKNYSSRMNFANQALDAHNNSQRNPNTQTAQTDQAPQAPPTTPGSQRVSSTTAAGASGRPNYLAIGDSLAYGVGGTLGNTNYARSGSNPQQAMALVNNAVKNGDVQGKHIILSGGASNAGGKTEMVNTYYPQMIQALKAGGASNVTVMGVGPYANYNKYGYHDVINKIAQDHGVNYTGPLANIAPFRGSSVQQQVHPTDYRPIVAHIQQNSSDTALAAKNQPPTPSAQATPPPAPNPQQTAQATPQPVPVPSQPPTAPPAAVAPPVVAPITPQRNPSSQVSIEIPAPPSQVTPPSDQTKPVQTSSAKKVLRSGDVKLNENRQRTAIGLLRAYK